MAVGLEDGFGEPLFAACFVFAVIVSGRSLIASLSLSTSAQVMYDASGVRLHAGRQAEVLTLPVADLTCCSDSKLTRCLLPRC
jgi:acid phosphatase family membrane protein YuiD